MEWQQYEKEVLEECHRVFHNSSIEYNVHIEGLYSKRMRQIDILIKTDKNEVYVVDAKKYNNKVNVKTVESFIGMVKDVGADYGIIVSEKGYTKAAINRAHLGENNIEVDILCLNELKRFQSQIAIPFAGSNGVFAIAPFGWIIDGTRRENMVATIYRKGISFEEATRNKEWAYLNFWDKNDEINTLEKLISWQNEYLLEEDKYGVIEERNDENFRIRIFSSKKYPVKEITLFKEQQSFIIFVVLFSPDNVMNRNINKIKMFLNNAIPLNVVNK